MRRSRLGAFGALCGVALLATVTGVATAATAPSATATQSFVAGSPSSIACGGSVDTTVTVTGQGGTTGTPTAVLLVLDLSGSTGSPSSKLASMIQDAKDSLAALDAADGTVDQTIDGNSVGLEYYQGSSATVVDPIGSSYSTISSELDSLPSPSGGSPHDVGITTASSALANVSASFAKAIVLFTDGQADGQDQTNATNAATAAKTAGDTIESIGIGTDSQPDNLQAWASSESDYQIGTPGPIDKTKLVSDLGAATAVPASFTLTEAHGSTFSAAALSETAGTVSTVGGNLQWSGTLAGSQSATLVFRSTRNGNQVFSTTTEPVTTASLAVAGGTGTVTPPASSSIDVLPCGASPIAATTCTGASCSVSGTQAGVQYSVSVGSPPAGTQVALSSLNAPTPPAGVCAGFASHTQGAELDIRPLTTTASFQLTIPKAKLGSTKWFATDICLGTNLRFVTALSAGSGLTPEAKLVGGGTVPARYWGLLPSIPRLEYFPGRGFVVGPWVTSRSVNRAGDASIAFTVPFVTGSTGLTTDGKAGYDPKLWG